LANSRVTIASMSSGSSRSGRRSPLVASSGMVHVEQLRPDRVRFVFARGLAAAARPDTPTQMRSASQLSGFGEPLQGAPRRRTRTDRTPNATPRSGRTASGNTGGKPVVARSDGLPVSCETATLRNSPQFETRFLTASECRSWAGVGYVMVEDRVWRGDFRGWRAPRERGGPATSSRWTNARALRPSDDRSYARRWPSRKSGK
jgi:hypothetical protein